MSRAWSSLGERGSPFMLHLIRWIALHLGRRTARAILYPITAYFLLLAPVQRRASRDFLSRALDRPATLRDVARHIHSFAAVILDRVFLLTDRVKGFSLEVHGVEAVTQQLESGAGCLLLGSHLGSFEVLRVLALKRGGLPLKVLMYPEHNQMITRLLHELNPAVAEMVIPLGTPDALLRVNDALARGEMVGLLGDRVSGSEKSVRCRFLGKETDFPSGPALLSRLLQAPTILCFGLHQGNGRYEIVFEPLPGPPAGRDPEALREWTQRYVERLEHHARRAPFNWFNFYDYWPAHEQAPAP